MYDSITTATGATRRLWPAPAAGYKRSALCGGLALLLVASPALDDNGAGGIALSAVFSAVLILGTLAWHARARLRRDAARPA